MVRPRALLSGSLSSSRVPHLSVLKVRIFSMLLACDKFSETTARSPVDLAATAAFAAEIFGAVELEEYLRGQKSAL
jgi:hypothetical protein